MLLKKIVKHTIIYLPAKKIHNNLSQIKEIKKIVQEPSYYPFDNRKKNKTRFKELYKWYKKNNEVNRFYNLYGFDIVDKENENNYCPYNIFYEKRNKNNHVDEPGSQITLLRDKFLFFKYMSDLNFPVPNVTALIINKTLFDIEINPLSENNIKTKKDYFIKGSQGSCGDSVKLIKDYNDYSSFVKTIDESTYLIQEKVVQHAKMSELNPHAVNTLRIITVNKNNSTTLFGALLRIGTKSTEEKDNTSRGGIAVGINEDGTLMNYGLRKPEFGGITSEHPDTHVAFDNFTIPFYKEAVELCCNAHKKFYNVRSIGWDVAITSKGPVFIEGNDDWELQTIQSIKHGALKELEELVFN